MSPLELSAHDVQAVFAGMAASRLPRYEPLPNRILMITSAFVRGGSERRMAATAAGLREKGYDLRLVASRTPNPTEMDFEDHLSALNLDARLVPTAPLPDDSERSRTVEAELAQVEAMLPVWWIDGLIRPFARAILEFRPSIVHGWIDRFAIAAGLVSCSLGVPRIIVGLTSTTPEKRGYADADMLREGYLALSRNNAVKFVNVSSRCGRDHEDWLELETGTISTVYTSLLPGTIRAVAAAEAARYRAHLGFLPDTPLVGTVMRLEVPKDPNLWLETAHEIVKARPDVRFLVAGNGNMKAMMEQRLESLGLDGVVRLTGAAVDVSLIYAALDVFLITSTAEGLPNTVVEAQAAGRPVVATDVGGTREAVLDGITALVVDDRSAPALARAVLTILSDPAWLVRAAARGPEFVAQRFGYDRMISETMDLYGVRLV